MRFLQESLQVPDMVDSNKEHGEGRSDVVVYDPVNGRVAILKQNTRKIRKNWKVHVILRRNR